MRHLLDTHAFVWWTDEPQKLSAQAMAICEDAKSVLFLSIASLWEMQIKLQLGKLHMKHSLQSVIERHERYNSLIILPVEPRHVWALGHLPPHHKDPFDRMIIAQAQIEAMPILTADPLFNQYQVQTIAAR